MSARLSVSFAQRVRTAHLFDHSIPAVVWRHAAEVASSNALVDMVARAVRAGHSAAVEEVFRTRITRHEVNEDRAASVLADLLLARGDDIEAERLLAAAGRTGNASAAFRLAQRMLWRVDIPAASKLAETAADLGSPDAWYVLAVCSQVRQEMRTAEASLMEGIRAGSALCAMQYAIFLLQDPFAEDLDLPDKRQAEVDEQRREQADRLLRRSADHGEPRALLAAGRLHEEFDRLEDAVEMYVAAIHSGLPEGLVSLGDLCVAQEEEEGAELWYALATAVGCPEGMVGLGILQDRRGRRELARKHWTEAVRRGSPRAMYNNFGSPVSRTSSWLRSSGMSGHEGRRHRRRAELCRRPRSPRF